MRKLFVTGKVHGGRVSTLVVTENGVAGHSRPFSSVLEDEVRKVEPKDNADMVGLPQVDIPDFMKKERPVETPPTRTDWYHGFNPFTYQHK